MNIIYQPVKNISPRRNPSIGLGSEGFKKSLNNLFTAFPGDVVVFPNFTGTDNGEFQGIPPTNKKIT
jgi:hypothetical protein